ncbi:hypothetical protein [Deinococcus aerophilus]|uniref:Lipoprotein n=1 Tax=Deinococcus aerophilus TaxID=522488 RepID=A0ABQ2GUA0_9DEIO|nr:hypothetical protein [Deinococcus aerophilus]GGM12343.1 hypothetical protein GCM10010841_21050 [Deinococcus aerophilus]
MSKRAVLAFALLVPLLGSCAPVASLLASRDDTGPAPFQFGPLIVGQTWTVSGTVTGRDVVTTVNIPELVIVPDGYASAGTRDQYTGFNEGRAGFNVATFDQERRTVTFRWVGPAEGFDRVTYTCKISRLIGEPLTGTLTYERNGQTVANGTCEARVSQQPG